MKVNLLTGCCNYTLKKCLTKLKEPVFVGLVCFTILKLNQRSFSAVNINQSESVFIWFICNLYCSFKTIQ